MILNCHCVHYVGTTLGINTYLWGLTCTYGEPIEINASQCNVPVKIAVPSMCVCEWLFIFVLTL